jgi:uncharacterized protein YunC (DUF1805 family)
MIVTADSVTDLDAAAAAGQILVAGSHGGIVAAQYAAKAGVRAVILHDAGLGKDEAGVAGLAWLDALGIPAAAVGHASARIADGADMLARGIVSRSNARAQALGVFAGMRCHDAAVKLLAAEVSRQPGVAAEPGGRYELGAGVLGLDSVGLAQPDDAGRVLVIGSHAALHGGRADSALPVGAALAFFHEGGSDCSRLPVLDARRIAAAAVEGNSARIGDARSMWESGRVSNPNRRARAAGIAKGMTVRAAVQAFLEARPPD